ncbi:hypothetical protein ACQ4LE_002872 [Meloidogyne hapla]
MCSLKFEIIFLLFICICFSFGVKKRDKYDRNSDDRIRRINKYFQKNKADILHIHPKMNRHEKRKFSKTINPPMNIGNKWEAKFYSALNENLRKMLFGTYLNSSISEIKKQGGPTIMDQKARTRRDIVYPEDIPPSAFIINEKWPECIDIFKHTIENGECSSCWAIAAADSISSRICIRKVNSFREKVKRWSEQTDIISKEAKFIWDFSNLLGNMNDDLSSLKSLPSTFVKEEEAMRQSWTILLMLEWKNSRGLIFNSMKEKLDALDEFLKWIENKDKIFYKAMNKEDKQRWITEYWCQSIQGELNNNDNDQRSLDVEKLECPPQLKPGDVETSNSENYSNHGWSFAMRKIFTSKLNNSVNIVSAFDFLTCAETKIRSCSDKGNPANAFAHSIEIGILSGTNSEIDSGCKPYSKVDLLSSSKILKCEEECTNKTTEKEMPKRGIVRLFIQWENRDKENLSEEDSKDAKRYHLYKFFSAHEDLIKRIKKEIMREGPVVAFISSSLSFTSYSSGIYQRNDSIDGGKDIPEGSNDAKRSILIIGWGQTKEGEDYWICKASMFKGWGEYEGNFRILQGNNELGIEETIMFPEIRDPETWHLDF